MVRSGEHLPEGSIAEELDADGHEQQGRRREDGLLDAEAEAAGAPDGAGPALSRFSIPRRRLHTAGS